MVVLGSCDLCNSILLAQSSQAQTADTPSGQNASGLSNNPLNTGFQVPAFGGPCNSSPQGTLSSNTFATVAPGTAAIPFGSSVSSGNSGGFFHASSLPNTLSGGFQTSSPGLSPSRPTFVFGATSNAALFGSKPQTTAFGQHTGFGTFGASANPSAFESASNTGLFNQKSEHNFSSGQKSGFKFGDSAKDSLGFATLSNSGLFGQQPQKFTFGCSTGSSGFETTANSGSVVQNAQPDIFGTNRNTGYTFQSSNQPPVFSTSNNNVSGTLEKFVPVVGGDTMLRNGVMANISTKHHCISIMKHYEKKSLEELRMDDYMANRKGQLNTGKETGFSDATALNTPSQEQAGLQDSLGNDKEGQSQIFCRSIPKTFQPPANSNVFSGNRTIARRRLKSPVKSVESVGFALPTKPASKSQESGDTAVNQSPEKLSFGESTEPASFMNLIMGMMSDIRTINNTVDNLTTEKQVECLKTENQRLTNQVSTLKAQIDALENMINVYYLDILGVPEMKDEDLHEVVKKIATTLGCTLGEHEIDVCHRCSKQTTVPRKIVVKFVRRQTRESFLGLAVSKHLDAREIGVCDEQIPITICKHEFF